MVRLSNSFVLIGILASGVAVATPQFDQEAELRRSKCDDLSLVSKANDVRVGSVERQHDECQARNLDFTFDAEKACGIKLATTTSTASSTKAAAVTSSASEISSTATANTAFDVETKTKSDKAAEDTAQASPTESAAPVTDGVPQLKPALGGLVLVMASAFFFF
ncbi:hypothetical protein ACHAQC_008827 [Fusarium culmorum]